MATLTQDLNSFKTYLVWYGNCEEETCEEFDLDQHKDLIEICYEWTLSGYPRKWQSGSPPFAQKFTSLKCGHGYFITLKTGNNEIEIPNLSTSFYGEAEHGFALSDCDNSEPIPLKVIPQSGSNFKTVLGWYGTCNGECENFNLDEHSDKFEIVYQWNENGFPRKWQSGSPPFAQKFTELECGHMYFITLKLGNEKITIPNFSVSIFEDGDYGVIASVCDQPTPTPTPTPSPTPTPTPTPTPFSCCGEMTESSQIVDGTLEDKNAVSASSDVDGTLCWNTFTGSSLPQSFLCPLEVDDFSKGGLSLTISAPLSSSNNKFRFLTNDGKCYETELVNAGGNNVMHLIGQEVIPNPTQKKKILALHGGGGNSNDFANQKGILDLQSSLNDFEFVFADAPTNNLWIQDPPNGKNEPTQDENWANDSIEYIDNLVSQHGEFFGILGYSQGAAFIPVYLASTSNTFKVALMYNGYLPSTHAGLMNKINNNSPFILPSMIFSGENDVDFKDMSFDLSTKFDNSVDIHSLSAGHHLPFESDPVFSDITSFISSID